MVGIQGTQQTKSSAVQRSNLLKVRIKVLLPADGPITTSTSLLFTSRGRHRELEPLGNSLDQIIGTNGAREAERAGSS